MSNTFFTTRPRGAVFVSRLLCALCTSLCLTLPATAQTATGKITRIVVGFPAGQATDMVARMVTDRLTQSMGQSFMVENRPGQGGSLGLGVVSKAAPDGSTLSLTALAAYAVNPHLYKNVPYNSLKDFEPVATVADLPFALAVNTSLPVKTVAELVAYAKANPEKLSQSSSGNGTLSHLLMEDFKHRAGIQMLHVPYQGSAKAMTDLLAGNVQVGLDTLAVIQPLVQAGKLRMLAVGTSRRMAQLPSIPTIAESGFPGFEAVTWIGLLAPVGTPLPIRERLNAEVQTLLKSPDFERKLDAIGAISKPGSINDFATLLQSEYARWAKVVKATGVTID